MDMKPLAFIGMSGAGKSHWSGQLASEGFTRYCCDDLIAAELRPLLKRGDGSIMRMGEWMGFPSNPQYSDSEQKYLDLEIAVMQRVLSLAEKSERVVIDTTGSVIYAGNELLGRLKAVAKVVYFETPEEVREEKCRAYIAKPLAVLWHGEFQQEQGESVNDALMRCYPRLIASRVTAYEAIADVRIGYWECRTSDFTAWRLLERVKET